MIDPAGRVTTSQPKTLLSQSLWRPLSAIQGTAPRLYVVLSAPIGVGSGRTLTV